jgi:hypothetical protein
MFVYYRWDGEFYEPTSGRHRLGQAAGERVLLADVVAAEHQPPGDVDLDAVAHTSTVCPIRSAALTGVAAANHPSTSTRRVRPVQRARARAWSTPSTAFAARSAVRSTSRSTPSIRRCTTSGVTSQPTWQRNSVTAMPGTGSPHDWLAATATRLDCRQCRRPRQACRLSGTRRKHLPANPDANRIAVRAGSIDDALRRDSGRNTDGEWLKMMVLPDLNDRVRELMLDEIRLDYVEQTLYISDRLTPKGRAEWPDLLASAAEGWTPEWLAARLARDGRLEVWEVGRRGTKTFRKRVSRDAHETLAEGEFNRFYIRAVCLAAQETGQPEVLVYRAKAVHRPRRESILRENTTLDAATLLTDLRNHQGMDTALRVPPGANSGLSVRLLDPGDAQQVGPTATGESESAEP